MMVDLQVMTQTSTDQVQKLKAATTADQKAAESAHSSASMTTIRESLSALVDNEATEMEVRRILKTAESDPDINVRWKRYQVVHSVLQGDQVNPQIDLTQRISAAIAEEPALQTAGGLKQWRDTLGKVAIAASVTFAFILGVQQFGPQGEQAPAQMADGGEPELAQPVDVADGVPSGFQLPAFAARTVSTGTAGERQNVQPYRFPAQSYSQAQYEAQLQESQALQNHFDRLLLKHAERASSNGSMGLIPFARISRMEATQE